MKVPVPGENCDDDQGKVKRQPGGKFHQISLSLGALLKEAAICGRLPAGRVCLQPHGNVPAEEKRSRSQDNNRIDGVLVFKFAAPRPVIRSEYGFGIFYSLII
jgi:hypothetical protein